MLGNCGIEFEGLTKAGIFGFVNAGVASKMWRAASLISMLESGNAKTKDKMKICL